MFLINTYSFGSEIEFEFMGAIPLCLDVRDMGGHILVIIEDLIAPANSELEALYSCVSIKLFPSSVGALF